VAGPCADDYAAGALRFGLVQVVHAWALGAPFADVCAMTDVAEGTIVRCITRLDETCRELRSAARLCGDAALYAQMEAASVAIKRDIVFATSLYVGGL
jgi:antiviral helicase SKI2